MIQIIRIKLSTGKILEENLVLSAFHQTMGYEFPLEFTINLNKAKSTLELLTKTVNVLEWPSYRFLLAST